MLQSKAKISQMMNSVFYNNEDGLKEKFNFEFHFFCNQEKQVNVFYY